MCVRVLVHTLGIEPSVLIMHATIGPHSQLPDSVSDRLSSDVSAGLQMAWK